MTVWAAFLICWFCRKIVNAGTPMNSTIDMMTSAIINSMSVTPRCAARVMRRMSPPSTTRPSSTPSRRWNYSSRAGL